MENACRPMNLWPLLQKLLVSRASLSPQGSKGVLIKGVLVGYLPIPKMTHGKK